MAHSYSNPTLSPKSAYTGGPVLVRLLSLISFLICAGFASGATVSCTNSGSDVAAIQAAVNAGGTATISGSCALGSSQINVNNAVTITGSATFVASPSLSGWSFSVNTDNVTFSNLTFNNAGVHVTGTADTKRSN